MKKTGLVVLAVLALIFLQMIYLEYHIENKFSGIQAKQEMILKNTKEMERELFKVNLKWVKLKRVIHKPFYKKPELILASRD